MAAQARVAADTASTHGDSDSGHVAPPASTHVLLKGSAQTGGAGGILASSQLPSTAAICYPFCGSGTKHISFTWIGNQTALQVAHCSGPSLFPL